MDYELQCWGEQNLKEYREENPKYGVCEVVLPWVVISGRSGRHIVEFSSDKRSEAMEYMMEHLIQISFGKWAGEAKAAFGVSSTILNQCILKYILPPDEKDLLSAYYYGGLKLKGEEPE